MTTQIEARPPFMGARPFAACDERRFFGRTGETGALAGLWEDHRLTILHGPPGVGKTSLLSAGVIPRLRAGNARVLPVGRAAYRPTLPMGYQPDPNPYVLTLLRGWDPAEAVRRRPGLSLAEFLHDYTARGRDGGRAPTFAVIDQAELVLRVSRAHEDRRRRFLRQLRDALVSRPDARILLAVRTEDMGEVARLCAGLGDVPVAEFPLDPLGPGALTEVVRRTLGVTGREPAADEPRRLVDELRAGPGRGGGAGPSADLTLLQVAGTRLWGGESAEDTPPERLRAEVDRAIGDYCAGVLSETAAVHDVPRGQVAAWMRDLARSGVTMPSGRAGAVMRTLEDRHLVRPRPAGGATVYELQHPRLAGPLLGLGRWPDPDLGVPGHLRAAAVAFADGDLDLAADHARRAAGACDPDGTRQAAEVETFLADIAYERAAAHPCPHAALAEAEHRYRTAAAMREALGDGTAAGRLYAAAGRGRLRRDGKGTALEEFQVASVRLPHDPTIRIGLAEALWQAGQPRYAIDRLNEVIDRDGAIPEALRLRGEIRADQGLAESALRDFARMGDRTPSPSTAAALALALATLSRTEAAMRELDGADVDGTDDGPVLLRAARVRQLSGDAEGAVRLADRAVSARHPSLPPHQVPAAERLRRP
ncbi:ATP-binding protein [Actinomadura graeca]|uniref:ATP-binding protein n=1 Tax=Actinomadura graeca TaxID=2750812 RepID=A0ABX8QS51_9ACTN|nr:ATP-binding protein [Actinomadura graeca]QXJ21605.1 ATP-binding protein [Actinomadura graeca]